jgi:O-antigen/teichoic acid export membrane protein
MAPQDSISEPLQKIAEGSSLAFIGLVVNLLPLFIIRLIIVREWTENDYGIFSLVFSIFTVCWTIGTLGFNFGISRNIAYVRGTEEFKKIPVYISASIWYSFIASVVIGFLLFVLSDVLSASVFHEIAIIIPLKIISFLIPLYTLINIIVSIYIGFDQVKPSVYFQQILFNVLFLLFVIFMIFFIRSFMNIFYAFAASTIITFVLLVYYSAKKFQMSELFSVKSIKSPYSKELIIISLPLLTTSIFLIIISWADTILLGILRNTIEVGLYNAALPLSQILAIPLGAILLIHLPIFTGLFAKNKSEDIRRTYSILTKWICYTTLPFSFLLFLYPEPILALLFGQNYALASSAMRLLVIGYSINNAAGPCWITLVVMGRNRFVMFSWIFAAIINVGLNIALIPMYGIEGAAFATGASIVGAAMVQNWKLYSISGVHPLSKNLFKPTFLFMVIVLPLYLIFQLFLSIEWWIIPLLAALFYIIFLVTIIITKSVDDEDLNLIKLLEKKVRIKSSIIQRILSKGK